MKKYTRPFLGLIGAAALTVGSGYALQSSSQQGQQLSVQAQDNGKNGGSVTAKVGAGQKTKIQGVILQRDANSLTVRDDKGSDYPVTLAGNTQIREKKSNPFRGAKNYTQQQLLQGMMVEVEGRGEDSGSILADRIRFTNSDLRVADAINTRVSPVEERLSATAQRVGQAEQNAQRMSGQIEELSGVANAARGGAKAAQESADAAQQAADNANRSADNANAGVHAANERILSIDDYQVKDSIVVNFKVGSALLSKDAQVELDQIADQATKARAFVIEVTGFASAEGPRTLNQRLSQRRADEVIRYLAENYNIPQRRFITPMGLGTSRPVGDNKTKDGRMENRRVEVKVLVSKGLQGQMEQGSVPTTGSVR